ncbi:HAT (Half-A-TPR) repeat-containing protein [Teratosphaeria destructans]|uniref:HAT (Half-A-TPR) repeat-containing protein n=1 Tax=Teratosphaeria destructans TaxID=418781 RepID=A0A9W7VZT8_9PEZI|nr:HAT (Half-A-TPR) repeat-containing protein [Teratosphaeria destructans]
MSGASDKARFYLEQYVPELQEYERKQIFTRQEITAITAKRSDFEHTINARGSRPGDYARYATYEMNLDALRKKRCKRLGVKGPTHFGGQRTVFFILDRATKKFPGDMGLWMQYIHFCQTEKAGKKLGKVLTSVLRLKPREHGLWILAAKWYAEQQGDMSTARSYMQRGLRFCQDQRNLWLEYAKLEMVYLAKLAARRRILGLDEDRTAAEVEAQEDENMMMLPTVTAEDFEPDAGRGIEEVDQKALERLASAPAYTGAIPVAIFDAAMKEFKDDAGVAADFYELIAEFDLVPSTPRILQHILECLRANAAGSPELTICEARQELFGLQATSAEFPLALGKGLARVKAGLATMSEKQQVLLAEKAVLMLMPYLEQQEELDQDVATVISASVGRYLRVVRADPHQARNKEVKRLAEAVKAEGKVDGVALLQSWKEQQTQG